MSVLRRTIAAISGLFLLQLMLVGTGTLCAMRHGAAQPGETGHVMQMVGGTQQTSSHQSTVSGVDDGGSPVNPADTRPSDHDGCRVPLAPGQCGSMSTCSISAAPSKIAVTSISLQRLALALPDPTQGQSGPTFAPELPPPRA